MNPCHACGVENPSYSRFCMGCGTGLLVLCASCGEPTPAEARFCPSCGSVIEAAVGSGGEMIKVVTILFADVVGSTAQAERMDPAQTRALMAEFFESMSKEIRAEGGTIERFIGDAIMAVFGVPVTHEDDQIRAVRAARRMMEALETFNAERPADSQVQVRIGINTGEVSAGGSLGQQLLVMGDAVNTAARFQQVAEPGAIVIGERTARAVRASFELRSLGPLTVKGKSTELRAFTVEGERVGDSLQRLTAPLVGRDPELKMLEAAFARVAEEHRPHLVAIIGEPGVGKSRLTKEFTRSIARRADVLVGRCLPYDNLTFGPLRDILRERVGLVATDDPLDAFSKIRWFVENIPDHLCPDRQRTAAGLASTLGLSTATPRVSPRDPREAHRELVSAWQSVFTYLASDHPLVVVIEDMHWADSATLEVLDGLVENTAGGVLFVCPSRPELLTAHSDWMAVLRNYSTLRLEPLTSDQSDRLVSLLLNVEDFPQDLKTKLLARAEGYPFFLEEMLNRLIDEDILARSNGTWQITRDVDEIEIPDNVHAVVLARLDLLSDEERSVVQHAAVMGRTFWPSAVQHLSAITAVDEVLKTLKRRQLIVQRVSTFMPGEDEYAFKHVLIRDVAYETIPRQVRGAAHAAAAEWIEQVRGELAGEAAEIVAHHYRLAFSYLKGDGLRLKARGSALTAAKLALERFAVHEAKDLGIEAVGLSRSGSERVEALEALGDLYALASEGDAAWKTLNDALAALRYLDETDRDSIARISAKAAIIPTRWAAGMNSVIPAGEIDDVISEGLAAAGDADSRERALLLVSRAFQQAAGYGTKTAAGAEAGETAVEIAERYGEPDLLSAALDAAGVTLLGDARYGEFDRVTRRRINLIPRLTDIREICDTFGVAAYTSCYIGRYDDAIRFATESMEKARGIDPSNYWHGLIWRIQSRVMAGRWSEALRDQGEIEALESGDAMPRASRIRGYGAALFLRELRKEEDHVQRYLEIIRRYQEEHADAAVTFAAPLALPARALAHRGEADEARRWLNLDRTIYLGGHLEAMCEVIAAQEDWASAPEVLRLAREEAVRGELLALPCFADRLEGRMTAASSDYKSAESLLHRSAEEFGALGARWEEAFSNLLLGDVMSSNGRGAEARSPLSRAQSVFDELGSVEESEQAAKLIAIL